MFKNVANKVKKIFKEQHLIVPIIGFTLLSLGFIAGRI